jgi:hypothetical protein
VTSRLRRGAALLAPAVAIAAAADEPDLAHQYDVLEGQVRLVEQGYSRTDDSQAQRAASLITESHLAMKGWGAVEQAAGRRQGKPIGPNAAFAASLQKLELGGRFDRAQQLMDQEQSEPANDVERHQRPDWTLAAYQDQRAQFAQPCEEQAVQVRVQALAAARDLHVKNEWTRKIQESLAHYRPKEYPILKDAKGRMLLEDVSPAPLADSPEPRKRPGPEPVASQIHD